MSEEDGRQTGSGCMTEEELRDEVERRTLLSPALLSSLDLVKTIKRLPVCIVCPSAQWYRIEDDKGQGKLECFCTQFRGLMFEPPRRVVTVCDGYTDTAD